MQFFEQLHWRQDRMIFKDYVFRIEQIKNENWEVGENCFSFYKNKGLVDEYEDFFNKQNGLTVHNLFELGIYGGGSIPFWNEMLNPQKHIGIDINEINENIYFKNYIEKKKLSNNTIQTFGGVDQSDKIKLIDLYQSSFGAPLDLIIDDASHLYFQTKTSFETLFPLLRPGGLYIIEDWAWGHWEDFFSPNHSWAREVTPTKLINELTDMVGTDNSIIKSLSIYQGFTVVERGISMSLDKSFTLQKFIKNRPTHKDNFSFFKKIKRKVKKALDR